jgi:hypothetical protein
MAEKIGCEMLKKTELEQLDLNMLAMYCQGVAESDAANFLAAEQAKQLKQEWARFIGSSPEPRTREDSEAQAKGLKERMVNFLSGCSLAMTFNLRAQSVAAGRGK